MDPKLCPEIRLIRECRESMSQAVIRLLQGHDTETSNVIRPLEFSCCTRPKRGSPYAHFTQFFDDMGEGVLNCP